MAQDTAQPGPAPTREHRAEAEGGAVERGREVYEQLKCAACHSVAGVGNTRHPLDGAGAKLDASRIRKWIVAPREIDPFVRKPAFQVGEEDLQALVDYVLSLRQAPPPPR